MMLVLARENLRLRGWKNRPRWSTHANQMARLLMRACSSRLMLLLLLRERQWAASVH